MLPVSCNDGVNVGGTVSPHTHTFWHDSFNCRLQTFRSGTVQHQLGRCCLCLGSSSCSFLQVRNKHLTARTVGQRSWEKNFFFSKSGWQFSKSEKYIYIYTEIARMTNNLRACSDEFQAFSLWKTSISRCRFQTSVFSPSTMSPLPRNKRGL